MIVISGRVVLDAAEVAMVHELTGDTAPQGDLGEFLRFLDRHIESARNDESMDGEITARLLRSFREAACSLTVG